MKRTGSVIWLAYAASLAFVLWGGCIPVQAQNSADVIHMKDHPVKLDKAYGAAIARIGEGRLHQVDATIVEIPAGGKLEPHKHLAEEAIFVISGKGYTEMWVANGAKKERFDWKEGDLLSPTMNVWHQHVNASPDAPARFLSVTTTPLLRSLVPEPAFATSVDFPFADRWTKSLKVKDPVYVPGATSGSETVRMKVGNLLPDVANRAMKRQIADADNPKSPRNLEDGITIGPEEDMASNRLLEMEVREMTAMEGTSPDHRHLWEVVYLCFKGEMQSKLQREGEPVRDLRWKAGDLMIVGQSGLHSRLLLRHLSWWRFCLDRPDQGWLRMPPLRARFREPSRRTMEWSGVFA